MRKILRGKIPLSLEVAPLVDIVLLLLIFFLLTASLGSQKLAQLDLPETSSAKKAERNLVIVIDKKGAIFVEGEKIGLEALSSFLRLKREKERIKTVSIEADADVPFKVPVRVMDVCRREGVKKVSILARKIGGD